MSTPTDLRFRQIHLDFHTSEAITGIGAEFNADEFTETLARAHVNSITCFARGHHGWLYYPSEKFPERVHPHLEVNLLGEQIRACHARDIRVPIYVTVQWDHYTATQHPEWLLTDEEGRIQGTPPFEAGFYRNLNVNSPYVDFLKAHVQEITELFDVDGFFFDIVQPRPSTDRFTQEKMHAADLDPSSAEQRQQFALDSLNHFKRDMSHFVRNLVSDATIFYNAGHVGPRHRPVQEAYSHWELESLPSGGWGYVHFPLAARYARTLDLGVLGMTGKFHTAWGDFHSYKNQAALEFECFQMLALNAKCSIGDQLPPRGKLDAATYELIAPVYAAVERKEPWCRGAVGLADIGLLTTEEFTGERVPPATAGAVRLLQESAQQFDILDAQSDLSPYRVVMLPDFIPLDANLAAKLEAYVDGGGALIATFESGLSPDGSDFASDLFGVKKTGDGPRDAAGRLVRGRHFVRADYVEYLLPREALGAGLPATEHAMYMRGLDVAPLENVEILADLVPSYFDRTWAHFCSHRQTPSAGEVAGAAAVQRGRVIYFRHPLFSQYNQNAPRWVKTLLRNALSRLLPDPLVQHDGPSTLLAALNEQPAEDRPESRLVLHLLHYIPERRGVEFDVIEEVIPLHEITISLRTARTVSSVVTAPEGEALDFAERAGRIELTLPKLLGHQIVVLQ